MHGRPGACFFDALLRKTGDPTSLPSCRRKYNIIYALQLIIPVSFWFVCLLRADDYAASRVWRFVTHTKLNHYNWGGGFWKEKITALVRRSPRSNRCF